MQPLDIIVLKEIITSSETINVDWVSDIIDISNIESDSSVQLVYDNGSSVEMTLYLAVSNDKVNFSRIDEGQEITDNSGSHIWDIAGTGTVYLRVEIDVVSGSIDLETLSFRAKRRH